jgi:hypothetical protein
MTTRNRHADEPKEGWFTTKVKALTAVLVAVGALMAAGKPILEFLDSFTCATFQFCHRVGPSTAVIAKGTTGWIYAGTRVNDAWRTTKQEGREPAVTIDSNEVPIAGNVYKLTTSVFLRASAPVEQKDGTRPVMPDSKGELQVGRTVKIDKVQPISLRGPPARTWIFAHVTLVD